MAISKCGPKILLHPIDEEVIFRISCLYIFSLLVIAANSQREPAQNKTFDPSSLRTSLYAEEECHPILDAEFEGDTLFERAMPFTTPDQCCKECRNTTECVAWEFRACCNDCWLYQEITEIRFCYVRDCVSGILSEKYRDYENNYTIRPLDRTFRGLESSCEQKELYENVTAVLAACREVETLCDKSDEQIERIPLSEIESNCEVKMDTNYVGHNYNNGFKDLTLSPRECCLNCKRDRRCRAWTRTSTGQCWLKDDVPSENEIERIIQHASGIRSDVQSFCGERIEGVEYYFETDKSSESESEVSSPEECCKKCTEDLSCLAWTFNNSICIEFSDSSFKNRKTPGAISAHMLAEPIDCQDEEIAETDSTDIAGVYNVECASILRFGPKESRNDCNDREHANEIFKRTFEEFKKRL